MPDTPDNRARLAQFVAQEIRKDGKIPHFSRVAVETVTTQVAQRASKPHHLSLRLRELGGLVRAAGDIAVAREAGTGLPTELLVQPAHVSAALDITKSLEEQLEPQSS